MKITTQTINYINKHYGSTDHTLENADDLTQRIGARLGAVDEVTDFGSRFEPVVIAKVVSCDGHPNADRLHICKIDDGGKIEGAERGEDGLVQVVCGASNVRAGMFAAWLPPGSTVPSTYGSQDPFVLDARDIRGQKSNGMLASAKELSIGDDHHGILEITEEMGPIQSGAMFADYFHLRSDRVIEIENKMFTHRPDCFGWLGVAREIEGIYHRSYKSPEWYRQDPEFPAAEGEPLPLEVINELPDLVPRFTAIAMSGVKVGPSPVWLQLDLAKHGLRSINNIVDYTNHYMLLTGQPLHAYDYDKVLAVQAQSHEGAQLGVRYPRSGEKLELLNGKEIQPRPEAILITAGDVPIGLGGVMGGADTEVDETTTNIIIESANFDMYSVRRTSMAHGLFTDAVTRFTKGQSPLQTKAPLAKMVGQITQNKEGVVASHLVDINHVPHEAIQRGNLHEPITVHRDFINKRLGLDLSNDQITALLSNVEFGVEATSDDHLAVTAPFWRTDIAIREDIVEEVGRLQGYDSLPLDLPQRTVEPPVRNDLLDLKQSVRYKLAAYGANEVLSYSFVPGRLLAAAEQDQGQAFQIANALSPELQYYRLSVMPSLLEKVHPNVKAGHGRFALFELGTLHNQREPDQDGLPREVNALGLVLAFSDQKFQKGAPFYKARLYLDSLLQAYGVESFVSLEPLDKADLYDNPWIIQMTAPFLPARSAVLRDDQGLIWGVVGEFKPGVAQAFKLPAHSAGFELDPLLLLQSKPASRYQKLSRFPKVEQDICLKVAADMPYTKLYDFVQDRLQQGRPAKTICQLSPIDIYQRSEDSEHKQVTLRFSITSFERTLTDQEVNSMLDSVANAASEALGATRV